MRQAQGTIKSWDPKTGGGTILDDAKNEYAFDRESYRAAGLRMLRFGQRVRFRLHDEGDAPRVSDLRIVTF